MATLKWKGGFVPDRKAFAGQSVNFIFSTLHSFWRKLEGRGVTLAFKPNLSNDPTCEFALRHRLHDVLRIHPSEFFCLALYAI